MAQISFSLKENATIVRLSMKGYEGLKHDKEATKEATAHLGMEEAAGRFSKRLVAQERISEINKVKNAARKFHNDNTLPWDDNSDRLLLTKNHMTYVTGMQVFEGEYNDLTAAFVRDFPALVEEAKKALGPRFNLEDYPDNIASRFLFKVTFSPVTSVDDFRCNLKDAEIERIKELARQDEQKRIEGAMNDAWKRLYEVIKNLHERTSDKDAAFKNTLITNIKDVVNILDRVNATNDPNLEAMRREIAEKFSEIDPQDLRTDKKLRKNVAKEADDIIARMAAYYNPAMN